MTTKLRLYNRALGLLNTRRLHETDGLTENVPARHALDQVYSECLQAMLERGLWKFALRSSELTYDSNIEPNFGFPYAYEHPTDFVRLAGLSNDPNFRPGYEPEYHEESGYWYMNVSSVYVRYVSNDADYGLDLTKYPEYYSRALAADMALQVAGQLVGSDFKTANVLKTFRENLALSKSLDAVDEPVQQKPAGRWARARRLGRGTTTIANGRMWLG